MAGWVTWLAAELHMKLRSQYLTNSPEQNKPAAGTGWFDFYREKRTFLRFRSTSQRQIGLPDSPK